MEALHNTTGGGVRGLRQLKVHYKTRFGPKKARNVPEIKLSGDWLDALGFETGAPITVEYENGCIIIRRLPS